MNLIIFGPPAAGKGTQSDLIAQDFKLKKISTGDLLRLEISKKTDLGNKIKSIIDKGKLVSDNLINDLVKKAISDKKNENKFIFDGYPRNVKQAEVLDQFLDNLKQKLKLVISLEVDKELLVKRVTGRSFCEKCKRIFNDFFNTPNTNHSCGLKFLKKRPDDTKEILEKRLQTYFEITLPILNFYEKKKILRKINGNGDIFLIYKEISSILKAL